MIQLKNPDSLVKELEKYGVTLHSHIEFDPKSSLMEVKAQFNGEEYSPMGAEADFGGIFGHFSFKKLGRSLGKIGKAITRNKILGVVLPGVGLTVGQGPMAELGKKYAPGYAKF